jgi:hypothetical protein
METHNFDAAALAGTTLAGSLTVFMEPGPFDLLNAVVGLTLFLILLAYERKRQRDFLQSIALASAAGFTVILAVGTLLEWLCAEGLLVGIQGAADAGDSSVPTTWLTAVWGLALAAITLTDRFVFQRKVRQVN